MLVCCGAIYNIFYPNGFQMSEIALHLFLGAVGCGRGSWALSVFSGTQPECKGQGALGGAIWG